MQVYKAAKYIRLSYTDDKSNESNSVGNQRKLIEDFVSRHPEIELVSEKVDDGYSGVIFDRPAFKEMMDDIMEGKINCVIVKDLSRLGREYPSTKIEHPKAAPNSVITPTSSGYLSPSLCGAHSGSQAATRRKLLPPLILVLFFV